MAGVAGLEPVTSAVTGQRSNQLSYTPAKGDVTIKKPGRDVKIWFQIFEAVRKRNIKIRAADAKEVGVGNPAEETCCYPNGAMLHSLKGLSTCRCAPGRAVCGNFPRRLPMQTGGGILRNAPVHRAIFGSTRLPAELIAAARFVNDCFRDGLATNCFDDATI